MARGARQCAAVPPWRLSCSNGRVTSRRSLRVSTSTSGPQPIRVPRERPPLVEIDDGPLVLVETRKDLREVTLPFEQESRHGGTAAH